MRIDSCRNCGKLLSVLKYCKICTQPIQFRCKYCTKYVDDQIHSRCAIIEKIQTIVIA